MHEVLVNRLGGLSLPRKSVVRLADGPDMTLDVYCGRKTTMQQQQQQCLQIQKSILWFKRYILHSTYNTMTLKIGQVTNNKQVSNLSESDIMQAGQKTYNLDFGIDG